MSVERQPLNVRTIPLQDVHLIEASAGTGKTYTITSLVLRFLLEKELPVESILAVTFTNAATAELKDRVIQRIESAREAFSEGREEHEDPVLNHLLSLPDRPRMERLLRKASQDADRVGVFTIHGFAARMLRDHAFESGAREDTVLIGDERSLLRDVVTDFWTRRIATLEEREFQALGGARYFKTLMAIGLRVAGAFEVPLVPLGLEPELSDAAEALDSLYESAGRAFRRSGPEVLELLLRAPLDGRSMRPAHLEADYAALVRYFDSGDSGSHPGVPRFTQSRVNEKTKKGSVSPQHDLLVILEELAEQVEAYCRSVNAFDNRLRAELCRDVGEALHREHQRAGTQSFDGLLTDLCLALRHPETGGKLSAAIRRLLPVALIDEFQDTDPLQYEIFQRIYSAGHQGSPPSSSAFALYLIGDPKQSIYAFRGADIFTYLAARGDASGGVWTLATSYRASPALVKAQNCLFQSSTLPMGLPEIVYDELSVRPGGQNLLADKRGEPLAGMTILSVDDTPASAWMHACAKEVAAFLTQGHQLAGRDVGPGDIAVLTRTNSQAVQVQQALREFGIPAVMHGDRSVLESSEALELRRILRALAEPGHRILFRTALATRLLGLRAAELAQLDQDPDALEQWTQRFRAWGELWRERGIAHALESLQVEVRALPRTLADRDGERRMTNFRHLIELLHEAEATEHQGVAGVLRWLEGGISDPYAHAMAAESRQLRLESDADAVTLTTAHKSKGLEYSIVFLPSLGQPDRPRNDEAFRFYDPSQGRSQFEMRTTESREESTELHQLEERQEALRLGYVALTRAKHHVVLLSAHAKRFSALSYLLFEGSASGDGGLPGIDTHLKGLSTEEQDSIVSHLCSQSEGSLRFQAYEERLGTEFESRTELNRSLNAPTPPPQLAERERTSSFSAMTKDSHVRLSRAAQEGRDIDDTALDPDGRSAPSPPQKERCLLADFPRGARPGDALHALFEHSPFRPEGEKQRESVCFEQLKKRGFSESEIQMARAGLEAILQVDLLPEKEKSFSLSELGDKARVAEMEFSFPVASPEARLSSEKLSRALGANSADLVEAGTVRDLEQDTFLSQEYLEALSSLRFSAWSGFLRGFIDLVYEHEGRLFVVDYKSNHLGDFYEDYERSSLQSAMEEHHYLLQAILYSVAIHRYGKQRISAYTYRENFGGVKYLFLRGMRTGRAGSGVYDFRPSEALIEGLSAVLSGVQEAESVGGQHA